jgi:hypothetical protein
MFGGIVNTVWAAIAELLTGRIVDVIASLFGGLLGS